jgi:hypothetical protein
LIKLIGDSGYVSLGEILNNLRVLHFEKQSYCLCYFVTRNDKNMPWPAPYEAGEHIDSKPYHCCSYATVPDDNWPEDTKKLKVYLLDMES